MTSSEPGNLGTVGDTEATLRVAVRPAAAAVRAGTQFVVEAESDQRAWTLKQWSGFQGAGGKDPLATLRREGADLVFAWAPQADSQVRAQTTNCLVEVNDGKLKRVAQLREPQQLEPLTLDLTLDKQVVEVQIADPPRLETMGLEITELTGFSPEPKLRGGLKTAMARSLSPLGTQPLVIEFAEIPGMEIRLKFAGDATGKLSLSIDPVFRDGATEIDLRSPKLAKLEDDAQDSLRLARRNLPPAQKDHARFENRVKEIKADEPLPNQPRRMPQWQKNYAEAKRQLDKAERDLNAAKTLEKTSQDRLDGVSKIRAFMKDAQKQATIKFVVFSECGEADLLLADARK